jgi:anti-sigma factor ChrR (cupin superfamily)
MITEQQQEQAARYALGELGTEEQDEFCAQVRTNPELRDFLHSFQQTLDRVTLAVPSVAPPPALKNKVMNRLRENATAGSPSVSERMAGAAPGLRFLEASQAGWKALPIPGAFIKLLSLQSDRGYAVLLGKLDPGVRYPAHTNIGPEDFYLVSGDLHVGEKVLRSGDFHHADPGSLHVENYSVEGCTLLAVLTTDDPLVQFAMG